MNLKNIRKKAIQETGMNELIVEVKRIKKIVKTLSSATDIFVPEYLTNEIELSLDSLNIPCYVIDNGCISIAKTYAQLYDHEKRR